VFAAVVRKQEGQKSWPHILICPSYDHVVESIVLDLSSAIPRTGRTKSHSYKGLRILLLPRLLSVA
jgi:hypothetical protein